MTNETKKTIIIVILSLIIIGLIWFIFAGNGKTQAIINKISTERIQLVRSTAVIESENSKIREESKQLRENNIQSAENYRKLEIENIEYRDIIDNLTSGSQKTENYLTEYGTINNDLANFIQQNGTVE